MPIPRLIIGNKNYSSWSLRPWLALKQTGIPFEELRIPLYTQTSKRDIRRHSPSGKVPALEDGGITIWDSLAICEYLAERYPNKGLWPADTAARAVARSVSAEMHSGFIKLRSNMMMNCRGSFPGKGWAPGVREDIERITAIWKDCRARYGAAGPMLFGQFSIADAMYAPVVLRFAIYAVETDPVSTAYMNAIQALSPLQEWRAAARSEPESIPQFDVYG